MKTFIPVLILGLMGSLHSAFALKCTSQDVGNSSPVQAEVTPHGVSIDGCAEMVALPWSTDGNAFTYILHLKTISAKGCDYAGPTPFANTWACGKKSK